MPSPVPSKIGALYRQVQIKFSNGIIACASSRRKSTILKLPLLNRRQHNATHAPAPRSYHHPTPKRNQKSSALQLRQGIPPAYRPFSFSFVALCLLASYSAPGRRSSERL
jgi:hypothetical protein